ncbi:hypothetical protein K431DRAFT_6387 [Polychaeton citri CBS 116435]|uniref:Uncharacterized protein n=1 Tax=Polychaeton citri CBS 116435 TaxID=1314669 RepID=A0A9P4QHE8_9PEZI|nr:hypothetical protein K431DRAFT_6387 [Polychaeton citri CBS 116435]
MKYYYNFSSKKPTNGSADNDGSYILDCVNKHCRSGSSLINPLFKTTGLLWSSHDQSLSQVSHILFDSGTSAVFVSCRTVEIGNLRPRKLVDPVSFPLSNGKISTYYHVVDIELAIAGVVNKITASIDGGDSSHNILLGQSGIEAFLANVHNGVGGSQKKQNKVTVAQDIKGMRIRRYAVVADVDRKPVLIRHKTQASLYDKRWLGRSRMESELLNRLPAGAYGEDWVG